MARSSTRAACFIGLFWKGEAYLIGSTLAELLNKETFNLYASLKHRNIHMCQASDALVEALASCGSIARGSSSVTLVRFDQAVKSYVDLTLEFRATKKRARMDDLILALRDDFVEILGSSV